MLSLAHTLISLPLAVYFENPLLIFVAAVVFHLLCDSILHWNIYPEDFKRYPYALVGLDVVSGVFVAWLIVGSEIATIPVLAAIAGGNTPDVLHALWEMLAEKQRKRWPAAVRAWFDVHNKMQLETTNVVAGLLPQVGLAVLAVLLVLR